MVLDPGVVLTEATDGIRATLFDPANRTYLLYLLTAALAAGAIVVRQVGLKSAFEQLNLLGRGYFISRSSLTDIALMGFNSLFKALLFVPYLGTSLGVAIAVGSWLQASFGDAQFLQLTSFPLPCIALVFSLALFVVDDGSRFLTHLAMHRIPVLWSLHKVHHSASVLTPLTIYRVHPLESAIYFCRGALSAGMVIGVFVWLFGRVLSGWEILGINAFGFLFNVAFSNLRHSHIYLSFGRAEKWFISPAQHQLHHSAHHHHANLGSALAIWDRLLGSWRPAKVCRTKLIFGIEQ